MLAPAALWLLAGCGGPPRATPTAIPASVVRPVQPTPAYPEHSEVFALLTPGATPQFVATLQSSSDLAVPAENTGARAAIQLFIKDQTPSAVGISPGGTAIYAEQGGSTAAGVPVGGVLTVTGKSADGAWYSVYNQDFVYGWVPASQLRVYGGEDLIVVDHALDPAPVATLLAQAAEPVHVLDDLMAKLEATPSPTAVATVTVVPPAAAPTAAILTPATAAAPSLAIVIPTPTLALATALLEPGTGSAQTVGIVNSDARLNLRARPDTAAAIVRKLEPGDRVTILEQSADGAWLRVQYADGATGWVAAEFVKLQG